MSLTQNTFKDYYETFMTHLFLSRNLISSLKYPNLIIFPVTILTYRFSVLFPNHDLKNTLLTVFPSNILRSRTFACSAHI